MKAADSEPCIVRASRWAMACEFEVLLWGRERSYLEAAARTALEDVERIEGQLSAYQILSEVDQINAAAARAPVKVSPQLFELLQACLRISEETEGAFDITAGPLIKLWGFYDRRPRVPSEEEIEGALRCVGYKHVLLNERDFTVRFDTDGVEINLGAVGKGYAVQQVAKYLREMDVLGALVHAGRSSSYALGTQPNGTPWRLGIEHPLCSNRRVAVVCAVDYSVSNSGCSEQFLEVGGVIYPHIIDPRTGRPSQGLWGAAAVAPDAVQSDALATAFFVMGEEGTRKYCKLHPDVAALLIPQLRSADEVVPIVVGSCKGIEIKTGGGER
ncbi:MAG: FAD:protein FMN transferase [Armatimonadota bacterium]